MESICTMYLVSSVLCIYLGILMDSDGISGTDLEYTIPIYIFIGCEGFAFFLTIVLIGVDLASEGGRMNMSAEQRAASTPPEVM